MNGNCTWNWNTQNCECTEKLSSCTKKWTHVIVSCAEAEHQFFFSSPLTDHFYRLTYLRAYALVHALVRQKTWSMTLEHDTLSFSTIWGSTTSDFPPQHPQNGSCWCTPQPDMMMMMTTAAPGRATPSQHPLPSAAVLSLAFPQSLLFWRIWDFWQFCLFFCFLFFKGSSPFLPGNRAR